MKDRITPSAVQQEPELDGGVRRTGLANGPGITLKEFEELFHQYYSYLCLTADHMLHDAAAAEDIVQEFYIDYWNKQNSILNPKTFRHYAKRAITNDCIDYLRKQKVIDKKSSVLAAPDNQDPDAEKEQVHQTNERQQRILDLVAELPESRKQILLLHAVEKYSYAQIAEKQGVSINTVRTQLSRAYSSLRNKASMILLSILRKLQH